MGAPRLLAALALSALPACDGGGTGPIVDDVLPSAAGRGAAVEILGDRFCGDPEEAAGDDGACAEPVAASVSFGEGAAVLRSEAQRYTQSRITVLVPDAAPSGETFVVVTREGVPSNPAPIEVLD